MVLSTLIPKVMGFLPLWEGFFLLSDSIHLFWYDTHASLVGMLQGCIPKRHPGECPLLVLRMDVVYHIPGTNAVQGGCPNRKESPMRVAGPQGILTQTLLSSIMADRSGVRTLLTIRGVFFLSFF